LIKTKVAFLEGWLFQANQGFLKTFLIVLIGWKKFPDAQDILSRILVMMEKL